MKLLRNHNGMLAWEDDGVRYAKGWYIGTETTEGGHTRATDGWPYSIYKRGNQPGVTDACLVTGIQHWDDAYALLKMLNEGKP